MSGLMAEAKADEFLQPDDNREFALLVDGQKVFVDRYYLACWSPVLKKIFYPEGAPFEQPKGGMVMKEKKLDDFLTFLHAVCPTLKALKVDMSNVAALVAYADEYDVRVLRHRCIEFMGDRAKGEVTAETLIYFLRLATTYSLKDLQKELVPRVAQLSIDKIAAAHAQLRLSVLSAVYQSKALVLQADAERDKTPPLPENAFQCYGCSKKTRTISNGALPCCRTKGVTILATAVAQVEVQFLLVCVKKCSKPCNLKDSVLIGGYLFSPCCGGAMFVYAKFEPCKKRSADAAAAGPTPKITRFSVDLLDRDK